MDGARKMFSRRVYATALTALLLGPLGLVGLAGTAQATSLVGSIPNSGAVLTDAPSAISLTTDLPLLDQGSSITVTDPAGNRVDDGSLTIDTTTATVGLKALTRSGMYKVTYTLVADGDVPASGSYSFMFNAPAAISSASATPSAAPSQTSSASTPKGSSGGNIFVLILLIAALGVAIFLALYIRAIIHDMRKQQKKSRKSASRVKKSAE